MKRHAGFVLLPLLAACSSLPHNTMPPVSVVVSVDRAGDANDGVALRTMTAASLRRIAPRARPSTVSIELTEPEAITRPGTPSANTAKITLAADAYPVVGFAPVVARQPVDATVTGIRVGVFTITDENGRVIDSMPIDWSIYGMTRIQALQLTADAIASRVNTLMGSPAPPR